MKKESIIAILSIIAIISTLVYSVVNYFEVENLRFRWHTMDFKMFSLTSKSQLEACNKSFLPVTFKSFDIELEYQTNQIGTFRVPPSTVAPWSSTILNGKFSSEGFGEALVYLLYFDTELSGTDVSKIDVSLLRVITKIDSPILGFIPISITKEYSVYDFVKAMNQEDNVFGC